MHPLSTLLLISTSRYPQAGIKLISRLLIEKGCLSLSTIVIVDREEGDVWTLAHQSSIDGAPSSIPPRWLLYFVVGNHRLIPLLHCPFARLTRTTPAAHKPSLVCSNTPKLAVAWLRKSTIARSHSRSSPPRRHQPHSTTRPMIDVRTNIPLLRRPLINPPAPFLRVVKNG